jgi:excisionase family DNA binding protein
MDPCTCPKERVVTINEAAERLGLHVESLRRMCRRGQVPAAKFGRVWRLRQSDIDALFAREPEAAAR